MLQAALVHSMASYVGILGAAVIAVLVVVPALFFYGWHRTGRIPPVVPALKAWLLSRAVVVACGACLVGAGWLALRWGSSGQEERSWQNPGSPLVAWVMSLGLFALGVALVFFGAWVCGKLYSAVCQREEGRRAALYELGILFGIAVFVQLINLIVITIVGPAPLPHTEETPLAAITGGAGGLSPGDLAGAAGSNDFSVSPGGKSQPAPETQVPEAKSPPPAAQVPEQDPEEKTVPQQGVPKPLPSSAAGGLPTLGVPSQAPETLWGKAVYLVFRGRPREAWQYAWAAYLVEESARVKSYARWCPCSRRPALLMPRIAAGVVPFQEDFTLRSEEGRRLLGVFSMVELAGVLVDAIHQFGVEPGNTLWVAYVREQKTMDDLFAAAREANVDVAMVLRVGRKQRGNRAELEFQCQLFTIGEKEPVWRSRKVTTSQYLALKRQGTNLLREVAREVVAQFKRHFRLRERPELAAEEVPQYLEQLERNNQVAIIEKVAVVKYLQEHGLLTSEQARQAVRRMAGQELDVSRPNESLKKWVQERLPSLPAG